MIEGVTAAIFNNTRKLQRSVCGDCMGDYWMDYGYISNEYMGDDCMDCGCDCMGDVV